MITVSSASHRHRQAPTDWVPPLPAPAPAIGPTERRVLRIGAGLLAATLVGAFAGLLGAGVGPVAPLAAADVRPALHPVDPAPVAAPVRDGDADVGPGERAPTFVPVAGTPAAAVGYHAAFLTAVRRTAPAVATATADGTLLGAAAFTCRSLDADPSADATTTTAAELADRRNWSSAEATMIVAAAVDSWCPRHRERRSA